MGATPVIVASAGLKTFKILYSWGVNINYEIWFIVLVTFRSGWNTFIYSVNFFQCLLINSIDVNNLVSHLLLTKYSPCRFQHLLVHVPSLLVTVCVHNLQFILNVAPKPIVIAWQNTNSLKVRADHVGAALPPVAPMLFVAVLGMGQTRSWKPLFTASWLAVWSRSRQLLKWNEPG